MEKWGVTTAELYRLAEENSPRMFPAEICSLSDLLFGILAEDEMPMNEDDITPMLILTNNAGVNGASVILYPNLIQNLAMKLEANLYVLPSSIHEILVIPAEEEERLESLSTMVENINKGINLLKQETPTVIIDESCDTQIIDDSSAA